MSYAAFNKRYNSWTVQNNQTTDVKKKKPVLLPLKPVKVKLKSEIFKCLFCSKLQLSKKSLEKHQDKCQRRSLKLRKKVMLQKVRSIIVKSRRPKNKKLAALVKKQKILPFHCQKCGDRFVSQQTLEMHIKYDHRPRPSCKYCDKVFDCRRKALEHENICNEEDKLFTRQSLGVVDILCSTKVLTCNKCENYFTSSDLLREHKHVVNKRNAMPIVVEQSENKTEKIFFKVCIKHLPEVVFNRVKYPTGENSCVHCHKEFQNEKRLYQHSMFCHVKQNIKVNPKPTQLPITPTLCTLCNVDFVTLKKLTKHNLFFHRSKKSTTKNKEISCTTCQKTFLTQVQYQKHFKQHGSPNICPICTRFKHFETPEFLRWHISLVHRKKYCFTCKKAFSQHSSHKCRAMVSKRLVKTTEEFTEVVKIPDELSGKLSPYHDGLFKCYQCDDVFMREIYLLEHFVTNHTEIAPYSCEKCSKNFSDLTEYISHLHSAHLSYDGNSNFTLCSLKSHLYKLLNIKKCKHCQQIFMGNHALDQHQSEVHSEVLTNNKVAFTKDSTDPIYWNVNDDILLAQNKDHNDDVDDSPIKSSGPPIDKLMSSSTADSEVETEREKEDQSCFIRLEDIETMLLLPLDLPCEEKKVLQESCSNDDFIEINTDTEIETNTPSKQKDQNEKLIPIAKNNRLSMARHKRKYFSYMDIESNHQTDHSVDGVSNKKKKKRGRPRKKPIKPTNHYNQNSSDTCSLSPKKRLRKPPTVDQDSQKTLYTKKLLKRDLKKIIANDSDSHSESHLVSPNKRNKMSTKCIPRKDNNNNEAGSKTMNLTKNTVSKPKKKLGRPKGSRKKKRFFNLYPDDGSESDRYNGSVSMVTINKPTPTKTSLDHIHEEASPSQIVVTKELLSSEFAPTRQANAFRLESKDKYNRLEQSLVAISNSAKTLSPPSSKVVCLSPRCDVCHLDFLDEITFRDHKKTEHSSPTPTPRTIIDRGLLTNTKTPSNGQKPVGFIDISTKFFAPNDQLNSHHKRKQVKPKQLQSPPKTPQPMVNKPIPVVENIIRERIEKIAPGNRRQTLKDYNTIAQQPQPQPSIFFNQHQFMPPQYLPYPVPSFHPQQYVPGGRGIPMFHQHLPQQMVQYEPHQPYAGVRPPFGQWRT